MKERPILFSGSMVRAILDGRKTQTRRVVTNARPYTATDNGIDILWATGSLRCPYGQPGDRLWVRETWCLRPEGYGYRADNNPDNNPLKWGPSIHMPRWASRITLEVTGVRVERVQDISEEDARAEGIRATRLSHGSVVYHTDSYPTPNIYGSAQERFVNLWHSINTPRGYPWESNPWVWVVAFKVLP